MRWMLALWIVAFIFPARAEAGELELSSALAPGADAAQKAAAGRSARAAIRQLVRFLPFITMIILLFNCDCFVA